MKICLLNDSFPPMIDGVANVVMNYAKILSEMPGNETMVGTPRYPDGKYEDYPYPVIAYGSIGTGQMASGYRAGNPMDLPEIVKMADFAPDIIHVHSPASAAFVARSLRKTTGAPVIYTYHTKYDIDIARAVKAEFLQKELIRALVSNVESCDDVWAVSEGAAENLRSLGYRGEILVMENGVDFPRGRAFAENVAAATESYDLPEGVPVFLFVGRIMNYKGLPLIVDALAQLAAQGADFRMIFVGAGDDKDKLIAQAEKAGLCVFDASKQDRAPENAAAKIIFTGPIRDREVLRAWNTRADLFLFPSTFDTNGLVVREAAACGLASVLIENSCAAEGVTDGRNGFLIEENANALADRLRKLFWPEMAAGVKTGVKEENTGTAHTAASSGFALCKEVGAHAMDELYISWDEAVAKAYERYKEVLARKAEGKLAAPRRESGDLLIGMAGQIVESMRDVQEKRQQFAEGVRSFYEGMLENAAELRSAAQQSAEEVREKREAKRAAVQQSTDEALEKLRHNFMKTRESWEEAGAAVKEGIAELLGTGKENNTEDTVPVKLAFFDMDGTLSAPRYRRGDGTMTIGFDQEGWLAFCRERGEHAYDDCLPVPAVFAYAFKRKEQGAKLYVLSTVNQQIEVDAKRAFVERVAPGIFDGVIGSESNERKVDIILQYAKEAGAAPEECELVEDQYMICLAAMYAGIRATHVSHIFAG